MATELALRSLGKQTERPRGPRYRPPVSPKTIPLGILLEQIGRGALDTRQMDLLRSPSQSAQDRDVTIHYAGDLGLLNVRSISIIGTRDVSEEGRRRATRLARELARAGVTVVSGLARGVDVAAHTGAIEARGNTVAVIGTPLSKAYPAEHSRLQEEIYTSHLLISPFGEGEAVYRANFPKRNRVMAAITDASVIVEASDTSGTLHQAAECQRIGRWLFILKSVVDNERLTWPRKFLGHKKTMVVSTTEDILGAVG